MKLTMTYCLDLEANQDNDLVVTGDLIAVNELREDEASILLDAIIDRFEEMYERKHQALSHFACEYCLDAKYNQD